MFSSDHQEPSQNKEEVIAWLRQSIEEQRARVESQQRLDDAWAQWSYSLEEWALFDAIDYRPRLRLLWPLLGLMLGLAIGLGLASASNAGPGAVIVVVVALVMLFWY